MYVPIYIMIILIGHIGCKIINIQKTFADIFFLNKYLKIHRYKYTFIKNVEPIDGGRRDNECRCV
jgi:hypothetical protein